LIKKFPTVWEKCQKTKGGGIFGLTLYIFFVRYTCVCVCMSVYM